MRISEQGQITIPKHLRDRFGMNANVEVEIVPTEQGLLIRRQPAGKHPWNACTAFSTAGTPTTTLAECGGDRRLRTYHRADTFLTQDGCFYATCFSDLAEGQASGMVLLNRCPA